MKHKKWIKPNGLFFKPFSLLEKKNLLISSILLSILVLVFIISFALSDKPPRIKILAPSISVPGSSMVIEGNHLKSGKEYDRIEFAGKRISLDSITKWTHDEIELKIPKPINSGMIYVVTRLGKSNGLLFTNRNHIPDIDDKSKVPGKAELMALFNSKGQPLNHIGYPGELLVIKGERFGELQYQSSLILRSQAQSGSINEISLFDRDPELLEYWSDDEIRFRLPDTDFDGTLLLKTGNEFSNAFSLGIKPLYGKKTIGAYQKENIRFGLYFYPQSAEMKKIKVIAYLPRINTHQVLNQNLREVDFSQHQDHSFSAWNSYSFNINSDLKKLFLTQDWFIQRAPISIQLPAKKSIIEFDKTAGFYQMYTDHSIVSEGSRSLILKIANRLRLKGKDPLSLAKANYLYVINTLSPISPLSLDISYKTQKEIIKSEVGDSFSYANIFIALCRYQGVPARQFTGFAKGKKGWYPHSWAEFYLPGLGWIPVDPYFADTPVEDSVYPVVENAINNYFGNLDARRFVYQQSEFPSNSSIKKSYPIAITLKEPLFMKWFSLNLSRDPVDLRIEYRIESLPQ